MGKISARLQARKTPNLSPMGDGGRLDRWLLRSAHVSQALLLMLGVFGYFYTVRPVYEKALLDEEIAQKTLQIKAQEQRLAQLTRESAAKEQLVDVARREAESAKLAVRQAKREARLNYIKLRIEYVATVVNDLRSCPSPFSEGNGEPNGKELLKCPIEVKVRFGYLLDSLDPADLRLLESLMRSQVAAAQPRYLALLEDYKKKLSLAVKEMDRLKQQLDEHEVQAKTTKQLSSGYFSERYEKIRAYDRARFEVRNVRTTASAQFRDILNEVGDLVNEKFVERSLP